MRRHQPREEKAPQGKEKPRPVGRAGQGRIVIGVRKHYAQRRGLVCSEPNGPQKAPPGSVRYFPISQRPPRSNNPTHAKVTAATLAKATAVIKGLIVPFRSGGSARSWAALAEPEAGSKSDIGPNSLSGAQKGCLLFVTLALAGCDNRGSQDQPKQSPMAWAASHERTSTPASFIPSGSLCFPPFKLFAVKPSFDPRSRVRIQSAIRKQRKAPRKRG